MKYKVKVSSSIHSYWSLLKYCNDHFGPRFVRTKKRDRNRWGIMLDTDHNWIVTFRNQEHVLFLEMVK